ncbi:phospholipase D-like domain-containing protein [Lutibaculum baratangense]|uniref:Phospholipase D n=1 Tax=Lutibaculum baratangense AMV1 TaxID=631454 RepID=V4RWM0_9HYPH|nr:phosphatidylserine/phosphatidylglycerophosphate/cardiolipin synthase family protein [Lutibaculum baratangense]ESR27395.1 Cardiolipin synthetase [Lutibaculum baratangense AMV1]
MDGLRDRIKRFAAADVSAGNRLELLCDGRTAYPRMLQLIDEARRSLAMEQYQFMPDEVGDRFIDALAAAARRGVEVRLILDWLGSSTIGMRRLGRLRRAGGELRWFNRPSPLRRWFGILPRDHRKLLVADGERAVTGGIGVGAMWEDGDRPPWRDNGVFIAGPAVKQLARAFDAMWSRSGRNGWDRFDVTDELEPGRGRAEGDGVVGVVKGAPSHWTIARAMQVLSVLANERFWIWDAYFAPFPAAEADALAAAARDGVDVRLILPSRSIPGWVRPVTRTYYRTLIETGVRIYEWKQGMMHAKSSVVDGEWSRIGSTDFNPLGIAINFELDVIALDRAFAETMEAQFLRDLEGCEEIRL